MGGISNDDVASENVLDLGSLLDEVKNHVTDDNVVRFLTDLMEFEKSHSYSYRGEITQMLERHVRSGK